ncbi:MAG TPA: 30S ribosomal protein S4 [Acidimicrobiia bacterium]|nr:30S ribosomal protein S4 [Acidimicrobiia bacterium]
MARYTGPVCRLCRRERMKLFLKGAKCDSMKCPIERRPYPPGQHGRGRVRETEYLLQLREKQKARRIYGVLEKQFRITFKEAARRAGKTGDNLLQILESRLDNVVFRSGFAASRSQARQFIRHGHIHVNGKRVDIPSYQLLKGDVIALTSRAKEMIVVRHSIEVVDHTPPMWIEVNKNDAKITISELPIREQIDVPVREQLIVELYSK